MVPVAIVVYSSDMWQTSPCPSSLQTTVAAGIFCLSQLYYHCSDTVVTTCRLLRCMFIEVLNTISVNSNKLSIHPSVFEAHKSQTIADSGTTLAYIAQEAYDQFINAVIFELY
jgi:hypothetical protein